MICICGPPYAIHLEGENYFASWSEELTLKNSHV